jgi:hypothetical protein
MRALFSGLAQNITAMASQKAAASVFENNARIIFGAVLEIHYDPPKQRCH